jgi:hypothetical protein
MGGILILTLMTAGVIFPSNGSAGATDSTQLASSVTCNTPLNYYANQAPAGSNFFGPAVTQTSVIGQLEELQARREADPALVTAHSKYEGIGDYPSLNGEQLTIRADQLAADPTAWCAAIKALELNEMGKPVLDATMSGSYQTLDMAPQPSGAPLIGEASPDRPSFEVLRIGSWNFKLDCGFQPVSQSLSNFTPLVTILSQPAPASPSTGSPSGSPSGSTPATLQPCPCGAEIQKVDPPAGTGRTGITLGTTPPPNTSPTVPPSTLPPGATTVPTLPPTTGDSAGAGNGRPAGTTCVDGVSCTGGGTSSGGATDTTTAGGNTSGTSGQTTPTMPGGA